MSADEALYAAWQGGNKAAGSELFGHYFEPMCRFFANKVARNPADVGDLVQRTFERCLSLGAVFEGRSSFRTFLFGVARNVLREHLRAQSVLQERFEPGETSLHDLSLGPGLLFAQRQEQKLLLTALRRIPLEHQVVLELYFWEDLSGPELAEILEEPEGTIRNRIRRARFLLEAQLTELAASDALLRSTLAGLDDWAASVREFVTRLGVTEAR